MIPSALALFLALSGPPQAAPGGTTLQTPPRQDPPSSATTLEDVVVTSRQREAVRGFVTELSVSEHRDGQLGRFDRLVCPGVMGMRSAHAQALNDQIARMAMALELRVGEPGCKANILIIAAANAEELSRIVETLPTGLEADPRAGRHSRVALSRLHEPRPVRWWHQVVYIPTGVASRVRTPERTEIARAIVLLDMERIGSVNFEALAGYVGMVALARLNADANLSGQNTILNLFESEDTRRDFQGLTTWDADYLQAIYRAPQDGFRWQQESHAVWRLMQPRTSAGDGGSP